jgi:protoheme IX farnesyltransferase
MPVLIGWSAVTNSLNWVPVILFLIVFFWTPPHYWPLSLRYKDEYAAANIPMLPVEQSPAVVAKQIVWYGVAMVATSLILIPVAQMSWLYSVTAAIVGIWFINESLQLQKRVKRDVNDLAPMRLFHLSISYLSILFLVIGIDPFIG